MLSFKDKLSIYKKLQIIEENYKEAIINFSEKFSNFDEIIKNFNKLNDSTLYEIKLFIDNLNLDNKDQHYSTNNVFKNSLGNKDKTKIINLLSSLYKLFIINTSYINKENLSDEPILKKTKKRKKIKQDESSLSSIEEKDIDSDSILEYLIDCYKYEEVQDKNDFNSEFYNNTESEEENEEDNVSDTESDDSLLYISATETENNSSEDDNSSLYSFGSDVYNSIMENY